MLSCFISNIYINIKTYYTNYLEILNIIFDKHILYNIDI